MAGDAAGIVGSGVDGAIVRTIADIITRVGAGNAAGSLCAGYCAVVDKVGEVLTAGGANQPAGRGTGRNRRAGKGAAGDGFSDAAGRPGQAA